MAERGVSDCKTGHGKPQNGTHGKALAPGGWGTATRKHDGNDRTKKLYAGKGIRKQNTIQINQTDNDT